MANAMPGINPGDVLRIFPGGRVLTADEAAALGKESKAAGYFLLPDYSPQEQKKPRVITRNYPPDDAA